MRHKSELRIAFEAAEEPAVNWHTFRSRMLLYGWQREKALYTPPYGHSLYKSVEDNADCQVSVETVRKRLKSKRFKSAQNQTFARAQAMQDPPYNWPKPGTNYNGWILHQIIRGSNVQSSNGVSALVYCKTCKFEKQFLLKYLKSGRVKQHPCRNSF